MQLESCMLQHATCMRPFYYCNKSCHVHDACRQASGWYHSVGGYHRFDGSLWLAASYKFPHNIVRAQSYANEIWKTRESLAGLLASFIALW